jgi:hypothetical protein
MFKMFIALGVLVVSIKLFAGYFSKLSETSKITLLKSAVKWAIIIVLSVVILSVITLLF